jgi:hypothetical protein
MLADLSLLGVCFPTSSQRGRETRGHDLQKGLCFVLLGSRDYLLYIRLLLIWPYKVVHVDVGAESVRQNGLVMIVGRGPGLWSR